jgi:hypothetical protein
MPQIKEIATLKRGTRGWFLAFRLPRAFRLFEMSFIVPLPDVVTRAIPPEALEEMARQPTVPVIIRMFVDASREDSPGAETSPESFEDSPGDESKVG